MAVVTGESTLTNLHFHHRGRSINLARWHPNDQIIMVMVTMRPPHERPMRMVCRVDIARELGMDTAGWDSPFTPAMIVGAGTLIYHHQVPSCRRQMDVR